MHDDRWRVPDMMIVAEVFIALPKAAVWESATRRYERLRVREQKDQICRVAGKVERRSPAIADLPVDALAQRCSSRSWISIRRIIVVPPERQSRRVADHAAGQRRDLHQQSCREDQRGGMTLREKIAEHSHTPRLAE